MRSASDDIHDPDRIRILLKDVREARQAKIRILFPDLGPHHLEVCSSFLYGRKLMLNMVLFVDTKFMLYGNQRDTLVLQQGDGDDREADCGSRPAQ